MSKELFIKKQQDEINEHFIYAALAKLAKNEKNKEILNKIADNELAHYNFWKEINGISLEPNKNKIKKYIYLAKFFGLSYAIRKMENVKKTADVFYDQIINDYPEAKKIKEEELIYEEELIGMLNDKRLNYAGAVVLGLNDALVELTGTLAGLTFAFSNNKIVGFTGLIMGFAASLSMSASGYLSSLENAEEDENINPKIAAVYTGFSYITTVLILVSPYFIFSNPYYALSVMMLLTVLIIAIYTYYISVAKGVKFKNRFAVMASISLGVAALSYLISLTIKQLFGIEA